MSDTPDVQVDHEPDDHRYVAKVDGDRGGFLVYHLAQGRHLLVHTEVDERFEGQGVGSQLVQGALDDIRDGGGSIVPLCPYVQRWLSKHDDYASLVDEELETLLRP